MSTNATTLNSTRDLKYDDDLRNESLATVEIIVQAIIFVLAVTGNSFVLYALYKQRQLRPWSRIYSLMAHLSLADLLVAVFNILPQLAWDVTFRFRGGDVLCRAVKYSQIFVLYLSTYVLMVMSFDRYLAVNRPRRWNSRLLMRRLVGGAWLMSGLFSVPQIFIFRYREIRPNVFDCWADFGTQADWAEKAYVLWFVISVYGGPLVLIAACYGAICVKIWTYKPVSVPLVVKFEQSSKGQLVTNVVQSQSSSSSGIGNDDSLHRSLSVAKLKTIKLTLTVVICFFVCWSPFCLTQIILTFWPPSAAHDIGSLPTIFLLLASLNSCCNPWIYLAFSESLTNHLKGCLGRISDSLVFSSRQTVQPDGQRAVGQQQQLVNSVGDEDEDDDGDNQIGNQLGRDLGHNRSGVTSRRSPNPTSPKVQCPKARITATTATT